MATYLPRLSSFLFTGIIGSSVTQIPVNISRTPLTISTLPDMFANEYPNSTITHLIGALEAIGNQLEIL
jgi:hypothetical protein